MLILASIISRNNRGRTKRECLIFYQWKNLMKNRKYPNAYILTKKKSNEYIV